MLILRGAGFPSVPIVLANPGPRFGGFCGFSFCFSAFVRFSFRHILFCEKRCSRGLRSPRVAFPLAFLCFFLAVSLRKRVFRRRRAGGRARRESKNHEKGGSRIWRNAETHTPQKEAREDARQTAQTAMVFFPNPSCWTPPGYLEHGPSVAEPSSRTRSNMTGSGKLPRRKLSQVN